MNTTHSHHHTKYLFCKNRYTNKLTIHFDDIQCEEYFTLEFPSDLPHTHMIQSYGLICVASLIDSDRGNYPNRIYLWNPLIQKCKTLPDSPLWTALAFGFVPQVNDYVVVVYIVKPALLSTPDPHSVMIGVSICCVLGRDKAHELIMWFDTKTDILREISFFL